MGNGDEYLEQLKAIEHGGTKELKAIEYADKGKKLRERYTEVEKKDIYSVQRKAREMIRLMGEKDGVSHKDINEVDVRAVARRLMEAGQLGVAGTYVSSALLGAQLYERIGKGKKAIPKLLKAAKKEKDVRGMVPYAEIQSFIERNTEESRSQQGESGLEGRTMGIFALFIAGGLVLSLTSLTATGNAISNLTRTTPGLLGVILFIAGLVGMFFHFKGK